MNNYHLALESRIVRNALIFAMFNSVIVSFLDKDFISPDKYLYYVIIQAMTVVIFAGVLVWRHIKGFKQFQTLFILNVYLIYSCLCQFFVPCSFMTFLLTLFVIAVFSTINKKTMSITTIFYSVIMILCIWYSSVSYSTDGAMTEKFKMDSAQTVIVVVSLILLAHAYRSKEIAKHELLSNNLLSLGSQSLMFIHDLKGQIFPPLNHINYLMKNSNENLPIISELNSNLLDIKEYIVQANQSFSLSNTEVENIDIVKIMGDIQRLYRSKVGDVQFKVSQDEKFKANNSMIRSILLNLVLNSDEEFRKKEIKNKVIELSYKNRTLTFKDNAGGFSPSALKKIRNNEYFTNKKQGSGVGLYTLKNYATAMNGRLEFLNEDSCAVTKIIFKKDNNHA